MLPLDHIGIASHDGLALEDLLCKLAQCTPALPEKIDPQGVQVRFYGSGTRLEILESIDISSAVAQYLQKRGEGLHHIAFRIASAESQLNRLRAAGFTPLTENPVQGADGKRIFFLHPHDTCGVLIEFCQPMNQFAVTFEHCDELEETMKSTGYCIPAEQTIGHVVTSDTIPQNCQSVVIHNASSKFCRQRVRVPNVPILISEISDQSSFAYELFKQWTTAHLVILPESAQQTSLPAVLLDFWASIENE